MENEAFPWGGGEHVPGQPEVRTPRTLGTDPLRRVRGRGRASSRGRYLSGQYSQASVFFRTTGSLSFVPTSPVLFALE